MNNNETIFALSSGHGKSGVAVIRVSGDDLRDLFLRITNRKSADARHAYFATMRDTAGDVIDQIVATYFVAPHSFTGTDVIEIYSHGAPAGCSWPACSSASATRRRWRIFTPRVL